MPARKTEVADDAESRALRRQFPLATDEADLTMLAEKIAEKMSSDPHQAYQRQLDTRALEKASAVEARQEAHEDICGERYKNIESKFADLKAENQSNHRDNIETLKAIKDELSAATKALAAINGSQTGRSSFGVTLGQWVAIAIAVAAVAVNIAYHH